MDFAADPVADSKIKTQTDDVIYDALNFELNAADTRYKESLDYYTPMLSTLINESKLISEKHFANARNGCFPNIFDYNDITLSWDMLITQMYHIQNECMLTRHKFLRYHFPTHQMYVMRKSGVPEATILEWYEAYRSYRNGTLEFKYYGQRYCEKTALRRFKVHETTDKRAFVDDIRSVVDSANTIAMNVMRSYARSHKYHKH